MSMTPSELKYQIENHGHEPYFFSRETMRFFGDTMRNYGVCSAKFDNYHWDDNGNYTEVGRTIEVWELFRKKAVKHGLHDSAYFDKVTFRRVFKPTENEK